MVYGYFVLALKPRELCDPYPHTFRNVQHVYRVKENVLARLRRDGLLEALFGQDRQESQAKCRKTRRPLVYQGSEEKKNANGTRIPSGTGRSILTA